MLKQKLYQKAWKILINKTKNTKVYPYLYKSFRHRNRKESETNIINKNYFTSIPNPGAGIGHQMANWIAGYWFAKKFELKFAHIPFSNTKWENFLGFNNNEFLVSDLVKKQGYKKVKIPLFDENNNFEIEQIKKIILSYASKKIIFVAEQDQFYFNQYDIRNELQAKFYNNKTRKNDNLTFSENYYNIAIHVRRGDITIGQLNKNPNLLMRWQDNDYFINALKNALQIVATNKKIKIYLFSQGKKEDFKEFEQFENIEYCLDMGAQDSFLHMVYADMLITSKSSFSYKPALLNKNIIISPKNFWHGYPISKKWILTDEQGNFTFNN